MIHVLGILTVWNLQTAMDELVDCLLSFGWSKVKLRLVVVDNGSMPPILGSTLRLGENRGTGGGWYAGLDFGKEQYGRFDWYWFLTTSASRFVYEGVNPVEAMLETVRNGGEEERVVGVAPAWEGAVSWPHRYQRRKGFDYFSEMIDPASMWRAGWFDQVGGWDRRLLSAWGADLELAWKARSAGMKLMVCEQAAMIVQEGKTYRGDVAARQAFQNQARAEMRRVLREKYGPGWRDFLCGTSIPEREGL